MPLVIADRVRETSTTVGTGTLTLDGAVASYQSFSAIGNGNTVYYTIVNQSANEWEVGIGTYTASGTTLSRDTVLSSSNAGSLVNFGAGTKDVWGDYPAGKAVTTDTLAYPPVIGNTTPNAATFTTLTATDTLTLNKAGAATAKVWSSTGTSPIADLELQRGVGTVWGDDGYTDYRVRASGGNFIIQSKNNSTSTLDLLTVDEANNAIKFSPVGVEQMRVTRTASAVNYVQVTGAATGGDASISAQGSDTNIWLRLDGKGGRGVAVGYFTRIGKSFANYFEATGSNANYIPNIATGGSDTNVGMAFISKGTGAIDLAAGSSGVNISNGGTVTAITRTASAGGYTSAPTITISPPTTAGGVQATATGYIWINTVTLASGGTGYTVGDVLSVTGGSFVTNPVKITVTGVSAGVITTFTFASFDLYNTAPANPASVTGGTGTGATFTLNFSNSSTYTITNAGSGYVEQPTVTFSGGGGSGAAAYASIGSNPVIKGLAGGSATSGLTFANASGNVLSLVDGLVATPATLYIRNSGNSQIYPSSGSLVISGATGTNGISFYSNAANTLQMTVAATASAVNYVQVAGAQTTARPAISAQGSDTNIGLNLITKGSSGIFMYATGGSNTLMTFAHSTNGVNYFQSNNAATGASPTLQSIGADTNIGLNLTTKGTGAVNVSNGGGQMFLVSSTGASPVNYVAVYGNTQSPEIRAEGSTAALDLQFLSKSTGSHMFYTSGTSYLKQFQVSHTASAVNYVQVTGAATGAGPTISVQGSDTNAFLAITSKGTSAIRLQTGGTSQVFINNISGAVNTLALSGSTTGNAVQIYAQGSDTNIPVVVQPKGTGALQAQLTDSTATGGNARGANAVDWQTLRSAANRVASGSFSVIGGGYDNTSGFACGVASGYSNSAIGSYTGVASGKNNIAGGGDFSSIVGGQSNTGAGFFNFVGAGQSNSGTSASAVTTQSATMNGTTAVTLSGSNANIKVGQLITGTSIASYTYVAAVSGTSLTLSQAASGSSTSTLSFYTPHGVVVGGGNNQATGAYSFIGGGGDAGTAANRNVASGDWSTVGGGAKNTASGGGAFVGGGGYNAAGGFGGNTASGPFSVVVGGYSNTASGSGAGIVSAYASNANGSFSFISSGTYGTTRGITGLQSFPASQNPIASITGTSQAALLVLGIQTTDATSTVLTSNGSAASTTNQIILPNNSAYYFKGSVIANVTGAANGAAWSIEGAIMRGANAASTVLIDTPSVNRVAASSGATAWTVSVTADTTNGGLAVTVTGAAATTIRWVAKLETTEVTF